MTPARAQTKTKLECVELPGCQCYTEPQVKKIADAIVDLKKCQFAVAEKERLIQERFIRFESEQQAWWQEPTVIMGGIAISFGVGTIVTFLLVNK